MKKRLFTLALIVGVVLSMCASAWADVTAYCKIESMDLDTDTLYGAEAEQDVSIDIVVRLGAILAETAPDDTSYKQGAETISWDIDEDKFTYSGATVKVIDLSDGSTKTTTTVASTAKYYTLPVSTAGTLWADAPSAGNHSFDIYVTIKGKLTAAAITDGSLEVSSGLNTNEGQTITTVAGSTVTSDPITVTEQTEEEYNNPSTTDDEVEYITLDPLDATVSSLRSPDNYIGLNPAFTNTQGTATKAGGKPKITTKTLPFTVGTQSSQDITITGGAMSNIDVYIAGKDAVKLFGLDKSAKDTNIQLTRANILKYGLPFRVVSYDIESTDTKTTKATIKIAYTGASADYKAFPLTIAASNALTTSKPVAKAVKITVGSGTNVPTWYVPEASTDLYGVTTADGETYTVKADDYEVQSGDTVTPLYGYWASDYGEAYMDQETYNYFIAEVNAADYEDYPVTKTRTLTEERAVISTDKLSWNTSDEVKIAIKSYDVTGESYDIIYRKLNETYEVTTSTPSEEEGGDPTVTTTPYQLFNFYEWRTISQDNKRYILYGVSIASDDYAKSHDILYVSQDLKVYDYYLNTTEYVYNELPAKAKAVEYGVSVEDGGKIPARIYKVSTDIGPYIITAKPATDKVKNGVTYTITQPTYDGMGNLSDDGYVTVSGTFTETEKETKTALTFTATNASTKKKSVLKVSVRGMIPPYYESKQLDTDTNYIKPGKEVVAGKVPSVKFKAKGSKTITYSIPDEDDIATITALGLSLDAKKGAFTALTKGKTYPTSYDASSEGIGVYKFKEADIAVRASNTAGDKDIRAKLGIIGAKPKFTNKTINFTATDTVKYITVSAADPASVRFSEADDTPNSLASLGLKLYNWDELTATQEIYHWIKSGDKTASWDVTIADGEEMPGEYHEDADNGNYFTSGDTTPRYYQLKTGYTLANNVKTVTEGNPEVTTYYAHGDITVQMLSEDSDGNIVNPHVVLNHLVSDEVYVKSEDKTITSPDESLKNQGILVITSRKATDKAQAVTIVADNVGMKVKGKLKISIAAAATSRNGSDGEDEDSASALFAGKARNGTASKTGNGLAGGNGEYTEGTDETDANEAVEAVTLGATRTLADLTAAQKAYLAANGYKVIAVLPEFTANVDGQAHDFDAELDEEAPEGEKMFWLAFPKDAAPSEDDEIVDFYDEAGALVEGVPASHKVIASPWLREGVTYEPVIAIKAE